MTADSEVASLDYANDYGSMWYDLGLKKVMKVAAIAHAQSDTRNQSLHCNVCTDSGAANAKQQDSNLGRAETT
jgi:hypothetical protein